MISCGDSSLKRVSLQKINSPFSVVTVKAEVADNDQERMQGLMFRKSLGEKRGMLFIFDRDTTNPFWMKNTPLPLDILFISADYVVVDIAENTTPFSENLIRPNTPYRFVLEVNAGFSKRNKVETGDRVIF